MKNLKNVFITLILITFIYCDNTQTKGLFHSAVKKVDAVFDFADRDIDPVKIEEFDDEITVVENKILIERGTFSKLFEYNDSGFLPSLFMRFSYKIID